MNNFNLLITKVKSKSLKSILNLSILYITSILGFAKFLIVAYLELPEIYGKYIVFAKLFKFFEEFEKFALNKNMKLYIVSHKTKYSQFSKKYNLHTQSNKWIKKILLKINIKYFMLIQLMKKLNK